MRPQRLSQPRPARDWRTRVDPLAAIWREAEPRLRAAPELEAKALFEHLLRIRPEQMQETQLRTFQRRVRQWRLEHGPTPEVIFPQTHYPGEVMQLDWTHAKELAISIAGHPLDHRLCQVVLPFSNWQWATRCQSESLLSLRAGLQAALFRLQAEAVQKVNAMNETERQPSISLGLARVYLNATDPKLATRTWQEVMEHIVAKKKDDTLKRWKTGIKDENFDCLRNLGVAETRPEHFDRALADGKPSTNVYLRRIHNHALGMEWLLKSVIPRLQWPKYVAKDKRAITAEEHAAIVEREQNAERRDFYELLWLTGAAQSDGACLLAEDINWQTRTVCFTRKKLKSRGTSVKSTLFRFSAEIEAVLKRRPASGPLFPYLCTVRAGDRATEFKQRCDGLGISGVSLHSCRYAWAERALKCGFPERFAQQALGHNSKAVHRAYAKHAEVTVPSLDDWEKEWEKNSQRNTQPKLLPVDFRSQVVAIAQSN